MIGLGSDHGGFELKEKVKAYLNQKGIQVLDCGCYDTQSVDYPLIAADTCQKVISGECELALLFCGTGIGINIAANKIKGIRAAHVCDSYSAKMTRQHNNANVMCLGGRILGEEIAYEIVDAFLGNSFEGGRHQRRVDQIMELEK